MDRQSGGYDDRGRQRSHGDRRGGGYDSRGGPPFQQGIRVGNDDRSRSRDRIPQGRGGRGGRGQDSFHRPTLEANGMEVLTNFYKVTFIEPNHDAEWFAYKVDITYMKRARRKTEDGVAILDDNENRQYDFVVPHDRTPLFAGTGAGVVADERSSVLTRRILLKCQQDLRKEEKFFFTDGSAAAYSASQLFEPSPGNAGNLPCHECIVKVKADCDDDHPEASHSRNRYYKVAFTQVFRIPFRVVDGLIKPENEGETAPLNYIIQASNTALKNAMLKAMVVFGRGPRSFYFPMEQQTANLLGPRLISDWRKRSYQPILGLSEAVHFNQRGEHMNMLANESLRWVNKENIPLLIPNARGPGGTLAGVRIPNLHKTIPEPLHKEIRNALADLKFDVKSPKYGHRKREERKNNLLTKKYAKDVIAKKLEERCRTVRLNQRLWPRTATTTEDGVVFVPELHTFDVEKDTCTHTVQSYNKKFLDITLQFPEMPLVRISKGEYFPVEFLYQALDARKGQNSEEEKRAILGFHDDFSGSKRIRHLTQTIDQDGELKRFLTELMSSLNLQVDTKPTKVHARVINEPRPVFFGRQAANIQNGSWNLRHKKFYRPASLPSFAVVDLAAKGCEAMIPGLLHSFESYGMSLGPGVKEALRTGDHRPVVESNPEFQNVKSLGELIDSAIKKARAHFLQDSSGFFRRSKKFHRTLVARPGSQVEECLVIPPDGAPGRTEACLVCQRTEVLSFDPNILHPNTTHVIRPDPTNKEGVFQARMGWRGKLASGTHERFIDLFDVSSLRRVEPDCLQWAFRLIDRDKVVGEEEVEVVEIVWPVSEYESKIDCPSLVFAYIPQYDTQLYSMIKYCTMQRGIQSRVVTRANFEKQTNKDSFFGGIALKVNTALSNKFNSASAWSLQTAHELLKEAPTLVIGIAMTATQGRDGKMVVVGTSLLHRFASDLRMCHQATVEDKNTTVSRDSMTFIVKSLAIQFSRANCAKPQRVLVYRSTGQDGYFTEMEATEVAAVKEAFQELDWPAKVTYVVVQSNSGICITPVDHDSRNVPSGTYVDDPSVLFGEAAPTLRLGRCNDFLLVPHGGLKGTSKPVYHRIICDEISIEKQALAKLTYWLSFLYGTATKAPRAGSVVNYSMRLANTILANLEYHFDDRCCASPLLIPDAAAERRSFYTREGDDPRVLPKFCLGTGQDESQSPEPFHTHLAT